MHDASHMPDDLKGILSDPGIVVRQDAAVFELIARWTHAPAVTAITNPPVASETGLLEHLAHQAQATRATTGAGC